MIFGITRAEWNKKNLEGWPWFAWRPVTLHDGRIAWLQKVHRYYVTGGDVMCPSMGYWAYFEKPLKRNCEVA